MSLLERFYVTTYKSRAPTTHTAAAYRSLGATAIDSSIRINDGTENCAVNPLSYDVLDGEIDNIVFGILAMTSRLLVSYFPEHYINNRLHGYRSTSNCSIVLRIMLSTLTFTNPVRTTVLLPEL